jgi:hypothetical protein
MVPLLWKVACQVSYKRKPSLLYKSEIPHLHKKTCIRIFIAALFIIHATETCKSMDELQHYTDGKKAALRK